MDPHYIKCFVQSVQNVFSTMLQLPVAVREPRVKTPGGPQNDVSGIIGLSGDVDARHRRVHEPQRARTLDGDNRRQDRATLGEAVVVQRLHERLETIRVITDLQLQKTRPSPSRSAAAACN
jgi:hypothetical protein